MVPNASRMGIDEKIDDFEGQKLVKKLKIALNPLLTNQKHVRINMGGQSTTPDRFLRSKVDIYVAKLSKMMILTVKIFHKFRGSAYKI